MNDAAILHGNRFKISMGQQRVIVDFCRLHSQSQKQISIRYVLTHSDQGFDFEAMTLGILDTPSIDKRFRGYHAMRSPDGQSRFHLSKPSHSSASFGSKQNVKQTVSTTRKSRKRMHCRENC